MRRMCVRCFHDFGVIRRWEGRNACYSSKTTQVLVRLPYSSSSELEVMFSFIPPRTLLQVVTQEAKIARRNNPRIVDPATLGVR